MTGLCAKRPTGDRINLELDQMAHYAARLMEADASRAKGNLKHHSG